MSTAPSKPFFRSSAQPRSESISGAFLSKIITSTLFYNRPVHEKHRNKPVVHARITGETGHGTICIPVNQSRPKLVLYTGSVDSACGYSSAATGPFYCPGDHKVYIDLSFYDELQRRFKAPGDFAMAYVIAHEIGHHVQTLLGVTQKVMTLRSQLSEVEFNRYLVRLELQADYYSGVWAHYANRLNLLEEGDLDEALNAASAVGDDRIQKNTQGYIVPDSFTHGTSEQRRYWFTKGFRSGDIRGGNTFSSDIDG
jgi:uncharacterized protein